MDVAYDHIQEETFPEDKKRQQQDGNGSGDDAGQKQQEQGINQEFADAYKAFSASPWGVKLGGFWASAKKQVRLSIRAAWRRRGRTGTTRC
jgi:hypothetical protein